MNESKWILVLSLTDDVNQALSKLGYHAGVKMIQKFYGDRLKDFVMAFNDVKLTSQNCDIGTALVTGSHDRCLEIKEILTRNGTGEMIPAIS